MAIRRVSDVSIIIAMPVLPLRPSIEQMRSHLNAVLRFLAHKPQLSWHLMPFEGDFQCHYSIRSVEGQVLGISSSVSTTRRVPKRLR
jgi:hypothetical protein